MVPQVNHLAILELTDNVASYMRTLFVQHRSYNVQSPIPIPHGWSPEMVADCDHAVSIIGSASQNRCRVSGNLKCNVNQFNSIHNMGCGLIY